MNRICFSLLISCVAVASQTADWPPMDEDLVFLFQDFYEEPFALDTDMDEPLLNYQLIPQGEARFDSRGMLVLHRGSFTAPNQEVVLPLAVNASKDFAVELWLQPNQTPNGIIVSFGTAFVVSQKDGDLIFSNHGQQLKAALPIEGGHVLVARIGNTLTLYLNGQQAAQANAPSQPWEAAPLIFGKGWSGFLSDIAFYSGAVDAARAGQHYEAHKQQIAPDRETPKRLVIDGKLIAKSKVSTPAEIDPYAASLSIFEYQVVEVHEGFTWDKKVRVAHWVVLDHKQLGVAQSQEGEVHRLVLEPFANNRQLANTHRTETLPADKSVKLYLATKLVGRGNP